MKTLKQHYVKQWLKGEFEPLPANIEFPGYKKIPDQEHQKIMSLKKGAFHQAVEMTVEAYQWAYSQKSPGWIAAEITKIQTFIDENPETLQAYHDGNIPFIVITGKKCREVKKMQNRRERGSICLVNLLDLDEHGGSKGINPLFLMYVYHKVLPALEAMRHGEDERVKYHSGRIFDTANKIRAERDLTRQATFQVIDEDMKRLGLERRKWESFKTQWKNHNREQAKGNNVPRQR